MAEVISLSAPEFSVFVAARDQLDLGNVSRFLQRLDTGARRVASSEGMPAPTIQIVSLTTGSLDVKLKLESRRLTRVTVAISAATLALGVATYLRDDPAANKASRALVQGDHARVIVVKGGGREERIRAEDLEAAQQYQVAAARSPAGYELLTGPQTGFLRYMGGEFWVELDSHPGLIIRVRDEGRHDLEPNARYTLIGEAHISTRRREESYFLLETAILLK